MSLRGISVGRAAHENFSGLYMTRDRQEAANNVISAATSTVRLIVEDSDLRKALIGMPIPIHAMIAVCASFPLKLAVVFGEFHRIKDPVLRLPRALVKYGLYFHTKNALTNVESFVGTNTQTLPSANRNAIPGGTPGGSGPMSKANSGFSGQLSEVSAIQQGDGSQFTTIQSQQDPFDLMGDLDWRFNNGFLRDINAEMPVI
ncbi:hypothetical protein F5Y16DRAFT_404986 [Xylariaceae sp. FL0255]|nr:hypothetical protein F5Y16DRAFT_404986 [Xylariaceae sp. FL0255]